MAETFDSNHTMTLKVKKFRAINNARIDLDGITVITGENGSGKSTLSKILYNTIKYSKKYELLIGKELNSELKDISSALSNSVQEIARYENDEEAKSLIATSRFSRMRSLRFSDMDGIKEYEQRLYSYLDIVGKHASVIANKSVTGSKGRITSGLLRHSRISRIIQETLSSVDDKSENFDFIDGLESLRFKISLLFEKAYERYDSRPIDLFSKELFALFHQSVEKEFDLIEYGVSITDWTENRFNNTNWIKNSVYVDTPMAINEESPFSDPYWSDLHRELKSNKGGFESNLDFREIDDVIKGSVYYDNESIADDGFRYKRDDGRVFNLDDCATGIKAFGILQLLANNGKLTKDTLLIVDEPEAHLHPQWIVEYARIVVLMNKHLGVKFFIASHNPDMVSAIKYISEKEGVSDRVNFYLAKKRPDGYTYDYKALKTDIEDIFSSFNIAIERINQYGVQDA